MEQNLFFGSAIETTLRDRTNSFDGHPLWASSCLISEPQILIDAYRDFLKAGVDILLTNTYQASLEGFKNHLGLAEDEGSNLFKKAVSFCREAIKIEKAQGTVDKTKEILIFGSLGSFGAHLADGSEYTGEYLQKYDIDHIRTFQREQVQVRSDAGVDGLLLATIPTSQEAFMMADLLKEFPHMKALLTFSCKDESHLCGGEKFSEVAIKCCSLNPTQILAVGVNCSPPSTIDKLISPLKDAEIPICAITLTDKLWDSDLKQWKPSDDDHLFYIRKWQSMGVKYIGGGCETSYKTIKEIGEILKGSKLVKT